MNTKVYNEQRLIKDFVFSHALWIEFYLNVFSVVTLCLNLLSVLDGFASSFVRSFAVLETAVCKKLVLMVRNCTETCLFSTGLFVISCKGCLLLVFSFPALFADFGDNKPVIGSTFSLSLSYITGIFCNYGYIRDNSSDTLTQYKKCDKYFN
jgi:hypothetical protein